MNYAKQIGLLGKQQKAELAMALWPKSSKKAAYMNLLNLETGKSKKIDVASVPILCRFLGVSADFLFGISEVPNNKEKVENIVGKAREIISTATTL